MIKRDMRWKSFRLNKKFSLVKGYLDFFGVWVVSVTKIVCEKHIVWKKLKVKYVFGPYKYTNFSF